MNWLATYHDGTTERVGEALQLAQGEIDDLSINMDTSSGFAF